MITPFPRLKVQVMRAGLAREMKESKIWHVLLE